MIKIKHIINSFLIVIFTLVFNVKIAVAVLPPEYYQSAVENSVIKTPAIVKKIKTVNNHRGNRLIKVEFESMYQTPPYYFSGTCYTFKKILPSDEPLIGPKFYYPQKNSEVYVTITADGGSITSFMVMSPEFKDAVLNNSEKIKLKNGIFYLEKH